MNETVFALISAFVVYGLSSLALPSPGRDAIEDAAAIVAEAADDAEAPGLSEEADGSGTPTDIA